VTDASPAHTNCRRLRPALGTFVSASCIAADAKLAEWAIESAFESIATVQRLMHPTSGADLGAIRDATVGRPVRVHRWTWDVLALSVEVNEISEGRFDPCLPAGGRITDIGLPEPEIVVLSERLVLDLGGIAKGFAVDRAIDCLQAEGCSSGEVNAGGDVRVYGTCATPIWVRSRSGTRQISLRDRACAVSDPMARDRPAEHRGYYSRAPDAIPIATAAAMVLASTTAVADALTKCVLLHGGEAALLKRTLRHFDAVSLELGDVVGAARQ
jgi:thiamine biosynthesis lipoprotein